MTKVKEDMCITFDPSDCEILGVVEKYIYVKEQYFLNDKTSENIILQIEEKEFMRLMKLWICGKRDFCKRYNHFCGVMGYFFAEKFEENGVISLNEYRDVEDNGINDGLETVAVETRVYKIIKFDDRPDFEHG